MPTSPRTPASPDLSLLRANDYSGSLMERAQRQLQAQGEVVAHTQAQLQQAATTALPQDVQLAALDRQSQLLTDAERTQISYRRLRETFDADELDRSLREIGTIPDVVQQRTRLTQLQASYAGFAFNPELAQRIDAQFAAFEPVVQRKEAAIRVYGGTAKEAGVLANLRHQMSDERYMATVTQLLHDYQMKIILQTTGLTGGAEAVETLTSP